MDKQKIERINELSRLSRQRELTDEEAQERELLRGEYLAAFRKNLTDQLENTYVLYPDGTKKPLTRR